MYRKGGQEKTPVDRGMAPGSWRSGHLALPPLLWTVRFSINLVSFTAGKWMPGAPGETLFLFDTQEERKVDSLSL